MARATALTIECVTWMNSILNGPISTICFGLTRMNRGSCIQLVFLQPAIHQRQREGRAVDRDIDLGQEVGHGADVVFVAVGQDHGADVLLVLFEEREVGHDQIDAQQLRLGEHHPAIHDDDVVAVANGRHIHAELAESAEGNHLQLVISHSVLLSTLTCRLSAHSDRECRPRAPACIPNPAP